VPAPPEDGGWAAVSTARPLGRAGCDKITTTGRPGSLTVCDALVADRFVTCQPKSEKMRAPRCDPAAHTGDVDRMAHRCYAKTPRVTTSRGVVGTQGNPDVLYSIGRAPLGSKP
jgi:hypothetical protein